MKEEKEGEASRLIVSLISSSYAARSFPAKWHSMRDRLEKLNSGLAAASTETGRGSGLGELLHAVAATVNEGQSLADRCGDEHYGGGKLRLRSDLDVVISRLGLHMRRLDEIFASGGPTHSRAIVLSKPGAGASRDDMRVYVKDIFARLRIGGPELRSRALASLNEILSENGGEKYVSIVAAGEMADGVSLLVRLLESGDVGIQEAASEAIAAIAGFECHIGALAPAGAIGPLIRVLETGSELAKGRAGVALKRMTANSDNSWSVSAQGGVTSLLKICDGGTGCKGLIASVLAVLKDISGVGEIKRFMVEQGAVAVLTKLLGSKEEANQIQAMDFLAALAFGDESVKQRAVREGAVEPLVGILQPSAQHSSKAKEVALRAIETLCFASARSVGALIGSGFLDRLLFLLRCGEVSVKESAVKSVSRLCLASEEAKKAMGDLGFMPELVNLLEVRSFEARETAAEALCSLISVRRNRRRFVQDGRNVNRILRLLDPGEEKPVAGKKLLLSALLALTDSQSARRRIVASDHAKNLEKLAGDDFVDAKKIVKKLSSNRFRDILYRIWSSRVYA